MGIRIPKADSRHRLHQSDLTYAGVGLNDKTIWGGKMP